MLGVIGLALQSLVQGAPIVIKNLKIQWSGLILALVLVCASLIPFQSAAAQSGQTCSPNREVNVRSGPGMSYGAIGTIQKGQSVVVDKTEGAWFHHSRGWTLGSLLQCGSAYQYPVGFTPDDGLIDISQEVTVRQPASDLNVYRCFPQDYSVSDSFNRGCQAEQQKGFPWGPPRAGFNFGYNDACRDNTRECNIQITTWSWGVSTGEELYMPGIGSIRDPDGGAAMALWINVWEEPGEFIMAYILHGFWAMGQVWDMEDMTTSWDPATETYEGDSYGEFTLETAATLRDHWAYQLMEDNGVFRGQCAKAMNCNTVTYVVALRWYDGSFRLIDQGQIRK